MATTVENPFEIKQPVVAPTQPAANGLTNATYSSWNIDPSQTVEARTAGIIEASSPLMQLAESRSKQQMNPRGLINSSIAVGAGQTAVLDAATNIAKQDASTAATAAQFNTSESNKNSLYNTGAQNDWAQKELDRIQANKLKESDYINSIKTSSDSAVADMYKKYMDALYSIDANKDLDAPAKVKMKQAQFNSLTAFAKIRGLNLDLDFYSTAGVMTPAEQAAADKAAADKAAADKAAADKAAAEAKAKNPFSGMGGGDRDAGGGGDSGQGYGGYSSSSSSNNDGGWGGGWT